MKPRMAAILVGHPARALMLEIGQRVFELFKLARRQAIGAVGDADEEAA
jgi:hypothetical protein